MKSNVLRGLTARLGKSAAKWAACLLATVSIGGAWANPVAQIGSTKYETLAAAIDDAQGGDTIELLDDIDFGTITNPSSGTGAVTIPSGKTVTLDLAGHKISVALNTNGDTYYNAHVLLVQGNLTVEDTSAEKTGEFINTYNNSYECTRAVRVMSGGTLTMNGGTVTATTGEAMRVDGTATLNSGVTVQAIKSANYGGWDNAVAGIELRGNATLTVNGAVVRSIGRAAIYSDNASNVITLNNGVFAGSAEHGAIYGSKAQESVFVKGGYYSSDPTDFINPQQYYAALVSEGDYAGYYFVGTIAPVLSTVTTKEELAAALATSTPQAPAYVTVSGDIIIDTSVELPFGATLTVPNGSALRVVDNGVLINKGEITSEGTIAVTGTGFLSNPSSVNGALSGFTLEADEANRTIEWVIETPMDLQWISWICNQKDANNNAYSTYTWDAKVANDITFPAGVEFEKIPRFTGVFDGQGHKINNLVLRATSDSNAMFHILQDATVLNTEITATVETVSGYTGTLAYTTYGKVRIDGVALNGTMTATGATYGIAPFVAYPHNTGTSYHLYIGNCINNMTVSAVNGWNTSPVCGTTANDNWYGGKLGIYNFVNNGSAVCAESSAGYAVGYSMSPNLTIDVINYENNGSASTAYGQIAFDCTKPATFCNNSGVAWSNPVFDLTYASTDYTAYYHEDEDIYNTEPPPVAQIGTTKYETLAEALSNAQDFDTVVLIADAVLPSQFIFDADKEITLDLAGHAITSTADDLLKVQSGALTVNDSVGGGSVFTDNWTVFCVDGGEVIVNGGRFGAMQHNTVFVLEGWITFNGGMVDMGVDSVGEYSGEGVQAYEGLGENAGYTIFAEPLVSCIVPETYETTNVGVASTVKLTAYSSATLTWSSSDTSIATVDSTGLVTFTGTAGTATIYAVAQNGSYATAMVAVGPATVKNMTTGTEYVMLQTAIDAASACDTLKLIANVSLTDAAYVPDTAEIVIDLDGHDIVNTRTGVTSAQYAIYNDGTLTIMDSKDDGTTGGHVYTTNIETSGNEAVLNYGTLVIEGGWFGDSDCNKTNANVINAGRAVTTYGTATLNGGHYTAIDNFTNGKYTYALYSNGSAASLTINAADIYGTMNGVISSYNGGLLTVNDATIVFGRMDFDTYPYRLAYGYYGNIVINGGTWKTQAKVRADDSQEFCDWYKSDAITITGGKFNLQDWNDVYGIAKISGGIFNKTVPAKNLAANCICTDNLDPETKVTYPYTVGTPVAQIGDVKYVTFADAIVAAKALDPEPAIIVLDTTADEPEGWKFVTENDVTTLVKKVYVAQIGTAKYETVAAAIAAVENGQTIELLSDSNVVTEYAKSIGDSGYSEVAGNNRLVIDCDKTFTLDLGGNTLSGRINFLHGNMTVVNGTFKASTQALNIYGTKDCAYAGQGYSVVTVASDVTIEADYGLVVFGGDPTNGYYPLGFGEVFHVYGKVHANSPVYVSGNVGMDTYVENCGTLADVEALKESTGKKVSELMSLYGPTINIYDGAEFVATPSGTASDSSQGVSLSGCAIVNMMGGTITGAEGVGVKGGVLNVSGGTITGTGAKCDPVQAVNSGTESSGAAISASTHYNANYPISITVSGGTIKSVNNAALLVAHSNKDGVPEKAVSGIAANVTGGTFIGGSSQEAVIIEEALEGEDSLYPEKFISAGFFTTKVSAAYIAVDYLCTTMPNADGLYLIVPAATVTFEKGEESAVTDFDCEEMAYPSGNPVEIALPTPTYTATDKTFAGWTVKNGEGDVITALPAGTTDDITLVATWTGAQKVTITESEKSAEITVTDEWIEQNVTIPDRATEEEAKAAIEVALNTEDSNGLKKWENYVLGLDGSDPNAKLTAATEQGAIEAMPVTSSAQVPAVDTGFTVEYRLDKVTAAGVKEDEGVAQPTDTIPLDLTEMEGNVAYYRTTAVITSADNNAVQVEVPSENTIGVLKVENAPKTAIIAVPWESLDSNATGISVSDLVRTANLSEGDELHYYKDGKFKSWTLNDEGEWEASTNVSQSGTTAGDEADGFTIPRGSAVWLKRQNPTTPVYLVGEVTAEAASAGLEEAAEPGVDGKQSWNMVASPSVKAIDLNEQFTEPSAKDRIIVPTDGAPKNYTFKNGKWGYNTTEDVYKGGVKVGVRPIRITTDAAIKAGTGFWYLNAGEAKDVEWAEPPASNGLTDDDGDGNYQQVVSDDDEESEDDGR